MKRQNEPKLTFTQGATEHVLRAVGLDVDDEGWVVDEDGEPVDSYNGHLLTVEEVAGIVEDDEGNPVPLGDNFADVADYVSDQRERGAGDE